MSNNFVEHVNLTVRDPERLAQLMIDLFGWHIRWQGPAMNGGSTIHVGSDQSYLALYTLRSETYPDSKFTKGQPLNHVGIVVDDLDAVEGRVKAAGLEPWVMMSTSLGTDSISMILTGSSSR